MSIENDFKDTGFHFSGRNLNYDKKDVAIYPGLEVSIDPNKVILCRYGLHGSFSILEALCYAPYTSKLFLSEVEFSGVVIFGTDKLVCSTRKILRIANFSRKLKPIYIFLLKYILNSEQENDISWDLRSMLHAHPKVRELISEVIKSNTTEELKGLTRLLKESITYTPFGEVELLLYEFINAINVPDEATLVDIYKLLDICKKHTNSQKMRLIVNSELNRLAEGCYWFEDKEKFLGQFK